MLTALATPETIKAAVRSVWTPREPVTCLDWSQRERRLTGEGAGSARVGPYSTDLVPYFRQVYRDLDHPLVHEIAVQKSAQIGYSDLLINAALYTACEKRRPAVIVFPTEDAGYDFNRRRLVPAVRACAAASALLRSDRDITQGEIRFGPIPVWFAYASVRRTLKSDPIADVLGDEVDEYPPGGTAISNARDRSRTFDRRKLLWGSTPESPDQEGGIQPLYEASAHRHRFLVPCPISGRYFELFDFALLRWPGGRAADPDTAARRCWLQSPHFAAHRGEDGVAEGRIDERHKPWMVRNGIWVRQGESVESDERILDYGGVDLSLIDADQFREAPASGRYRRLAEKLRDHPHAADAADSGVRIVGGDPGVGGLRPPASTMAYRINTLASLIAGEGWGGIVRTALKERFGPDFQKKTMGVAPSIRGDILAGGHLLDRCLPASAGGYERGTAPEPAAWISVGVDVQKHCVYLLAIAFGGEYPALADAIRISREEPAQLADIEGDLAAWRCRVGSVAVRPSFVGIDSGHWTSDVYALIRRLRARGVRAMPTKGVAGALARGPWRVTRTAETDRRGLKTGREIDLMHIDVNQIKTAVYQLLAESRPDAEVGANHLLLPEAYAFDDGRVSGSTEDLIHQLTAERRVEKQVRGRRVWLWEPRKIGIDNHYLDAAGIALAGAMVHGAHRLAPGVMRGALERMRMEKSTDPARAEPPGPRMTRSEIRREMRRRRR
jgi:phage terminase large subunit GpA-like protein